MKTIQIKCGIAAFFMSLTGCFSDPNMIYKQRLPTAKPVRNVTRIDSAMACMDNMMAKRQLPRIYITSLGLPIRAGDKVSVSGIDMLHKAISDSSKISQVFQYVDLSSFAPPMLTANTNQKMNDTTLISQSAIADWIKGLPANVIFNYPQWEIAGSISQIDDNVTSENRGAGGSFSNGDLGFSTDQISSIINIDLKLIDFRTRQMLNGSATSNGMVVLRSSYAADIGARIKSNMGLSVDFSNEVNQSGGQAVRTLIQFTVMQLLGNLLHLPYQSCFNDDAPPSYDALVDETQKTTAPELRLKLATDRGADNPIYRITENLSFSVTANEAADVHCYIQGPDRQIVRLFPNRSQNQSRLAAGQTVTVSPSTTHFDYRFDKIGFEQLVCLASTGTLHSPWPISQPSGAALPVFDFNDIESGYRQLTAGIVKIHKLDIYIKQ